MSRRDPLAKLLVDSALELHRQRPWEDIHGDELVLVRVPTEEEPVAVSIMGQSGQEYGLTLFRGPGAFARTMRGFERNAGSGTLDEEADVIGYSFGAWDEIPREFRAFLRSAGLRPGTTRAIPWLLSKRPYEIGKPPEREDLRTLAWVVQGVLAARAAGDLRTPGLSRRRRRVLEIEVSGDLRRPNCATRLVDPSDDAGVDVGAGDDPLPLALPGGLRELPRIAGEWGLARIATNTSIAEDDRQTAVALIVDEGGAIVETEVLQGDELTPLAAALARTFRGEGPNERQAGLPRRIRIADRRVHAALAPGLGALGIEAVHDPDDPRLRAVVDDFRERLERIAAAAEAEARAHGPDTEPAELTEWKAADRRTIEWIVETAGGRELITPRARKRFFGDEAGETLASDTFPREMVGGALLEWTAADYRATRRSRTMIEKLLERRRFPPGVRAMLEARRDAVLSIFRIDACDPGASLDVTDVLSGKRFTLSDRALSGSAREGLYVPLRLFSVERWTFPSVAGPPLSLLQIDHALAALEGWGHPLESNPERQDAHLFGRLFALAAEWSAHPPRLQNTDGEPLRLQTATFGVADSRALVRALEARADVEREEDGSWVWFACDRSPTGGPGATVLGRLESIGDRLVLEVNSEPRLARARAWLETVPGVRFERATERPLAEHELPPDDRLPHPPEAPLDPAERRDFERFARTVALKWLDTRVPALGHLTPREACASAEGRARVAIMVRTMAPLLTPSGPIAAPRAEMLRELGIDAED